MGLLRYNLPKKFSLNKLPPRYIATSLQPPEKWPQKKNTPSLHRYFATTFRKMASEKKYPQTTSLLRYNLPKNGLRKKIPPNYIATSLQPPEKWPPKKNTPSLHRYFATTSRKMASEKKYPQTTLLLRYNLPKKFSLNKITPRYIATSLQPYRKMPSEK